MHYLKKYPSLSKDFPKTRVGNWGLLVLFSLSLSACASYDLEEGLAQTNAHIQGFTEEKVRLAQTEAQQQERLAVAQRLLAAPIGQKEAVQLLLVNSPAFQAMLANNWAAAANAAQTGRILNPVFSFERLVAGPELEITQFLAFGLLDLLSLPYRKSIADQRIQMATISLSTEVVNQMTLVRQAWVRAVAAQQSLLYAEKASEGANLSAELAERMQAAGNFNKLMQARYQSAGAIARTQLITARQLALASREELIRLLGLTAQQAQQLQLPESLPALPQEPLLAEAVTQQAMQDRLDVQMAKATLQAAAKAQGLDGVVSFTDVELRLQRSRTSDSETGDYLVSRGYEIGIRLPIFDWGGMRRQAMGAQTLAAANQLEATLRSAESSLRESYAAYRAAYDISKIHQEQLVPLSKVIAEENLLNYNGMIIGVFELLAEPGKQAAAGLQAIAAQQQFWLADAALQAGLIGQPMAGAVMMANAAGGAGANAAGH